MPLTDAQLADPGTEVPARYVADFDNLVLSHADRTRILADEHRPRVMTVNGIVYCNSNIYVGGGGTLTFGNAVAAAGTIFALVEDPDGVKKFWNNIPNYLDSGHDVLSRFEKFVSELTAQGEKIRSVVENAVRRRRVHMGDDIAALEQRQDGAHRRVGLADVDHDRQVEGRRRLLGAPQRLEIVAAGHVIR